MAYTGADLLNLQDNIKRDPQGYADEFALQLRHFKATTTLFKLSPTQESREFNDLVVFIAHTVGHYPLHVKPYAEELLSILETNASLLASATRLALVKSLILMRNKRHIEATELIPSLFRLFRVQDKLLTHLILRHITADIKAANKGHKNDKFNRFVQAFLYKVLEGDHEGSAKRALSILTEMWRRHVWRDARTVNVIASAVFHESSRIMVAALKFFLGQDVDQDDVDSDSDEGGDGDKGDKATGNSSIPVAPSKEEVYKAFHKGTVSSKKKKQKKLKRAMAAVRKASRRGDATGAYGQISFAALQLLHDPQGFADRLFARLRQAKERFETRLLMMTVLSRAIGVHKLLVLNFYPFLLKYIAPAQRDVIQVLACLVQACHDIVPPEDLTPVLRQLVDQFVHDKARPEVMTIGLKTVREVCMRAPLIINEDLLRDLVEYKKFRDKEVSAAARGLLGLFRELAPGMLAKKDRGKGADITVVPMAYGLSRVAERIEGVELLEEAVRAGQVGPDGTLREDSSDEVSSGEEEEEEEEEEEGESDDAGDELSLELSPRESDLSGEDANGADEEDDDDDEEHDDEEEHEEEEEHENVKAANKISNRKSKDAEPESLAALRKRLREAQSKDGKEESTKESIPVEWGRVLTQEDFIAIRQLRHKQLVDAALKKHGLVSASKKAKLREMAEVEAEDALALQDRLGVLHEHKVDATSLVGGRRGRRDKEERMASVLEGREGREFGAKSRIKKNKTGGLSNREKAKRKNLPFAARAGQARRRMAKDKMKSAKNFKGHVRK